jgi:NADH-quinone oxidoreductase subunit J
LPAAVITAEERKLLANTLPKLDEAEKALDGDVSNGDARIARLKEFEKVFTPAKSNLESVVGGGREGSGLLGGGSLALRLERPSARPGETAALYRTDPQALDAIRQAAKVRTASRAVSQGVENVLLTKDPDISIAKAEVRKLRNEVVILHGMGELPANNVRNLGFVLYSEHLLAIELAGTLLLVATIGAVAVAQRKGVAK